jgi:ubiquinone/menaquinone biosynthesis C-methylase UbiE
MPRRLALRASAWHGAPMPSTLTRVLEPEVMDTAEEASDYDAMDHAVVNAAFCDDFLAEGAVGARVLDVGTGTARIPLALCAREANAQIVAVDLADHMLAVANANVTNAGLDARITLQKIDAKGLPFADGTFSAVVSNTVIHHIAEPTAVLAEMRRVLAPSGQLFVRDLVRPTTEAELDRLVALHAGTPPHEPKARAAFQRQRELLRASLHAGLTVEEVASCMQKAGLTGGTVRMTSDRHWTMSYRKP